MGSSEQVERFNAAVIGYPVEHSLSPTIHNAVYEALGIPWIYGRVSAPSDNDARAAVISARMDAMSASSPSEVVAGFNITTPYKHLAMSLADRANVTSEIVGVANTLSFSEECDEFACRTVILCDTTDGEGACRAIERSGYALEGARAMVLGTGGAAMSVIMSAIMRGADVVVVSRDPVSALAKVAEMLDRADACAARGVLASWGFGSDAHPVSWERPSLGGDGARIRTVGYPEAMGMVSSCNVIVNATTVGMNPGDGSPLEGASFAPGQLVMDAVYAQGRTALLRDADAADADTLDGLSMLVEQALLTIWIWATGNWIEFDPDSDAVRGALKGIVAGD